MDIGAAPVARELGLKLTTCRGVKFLVWEEMGAPMGLEVREAAQVEYHVTDWTARFTPD